MHSAVHPTHRWLLIAGLALATFGGSPPASSQTLSVDDLLAGVVRVKTFVPADARSANTLGREREGNGIILDHSGLILTVAYLTNEATGGEVTFSNGRTVPAQIQASDPDTGLSLLRTIDPPKLKPLALGNSSSLKERDPVVIAGFSSDKLMPATVVSRRTFAGSWEFLIEEAVFTVPPHPLWSGAALLDSQARIVGIGYLLVQDAAGTEAVTPGNMFIPIDSLKPILADLITDGRASGPAPPWLGMTTQDVRGNLFVSRVTPEGPAAAAGIKHGDVVMGVGGERTTSLADFFRKVRALGPAGTAIPLTVLQAGESRSVTVKSGDRRDFQRIRGTL